MAPELSYVDSIAGVLSSMLFRVIAFVGLGIGLFLFTAGLVWLWMLARSQARWHEKPEDPRHGPYS